MVGSLVWPKADGDVLFAADHNYMRAQVYEDIQAGSIINTTANHVIAGSIVIPHVGTSGVLLGLHFNGWIGNTDAGTNTDSRIHVSGANTGFFTVSSVINRTVSAVNNMHVLTPAGDSSDTFRYDDGPGSRAAGTSIYPLLPLSPLDSSIIIFVTTRDGGAGSTILADWSLRACVQEMAYYSL